MATATERFEVIGELYYRRHHRLRPGKSEAPETYRDSSSEENREQFESWLATKGFLDAIDRIAELEANLPKLNEDHARDLAVYISLRLPERLPLSGDRNEANEVISRLIREWKP